MFNNRLLAMTMLFLATTAAMTPVAFFAGLERGRRLAAADRAKFSHNGTDSELRALTGDANSGPVTICGGEGPFGAALASIFCKPLLQNTSQAATAPGTAAPIAAASPGQSQILRDKMIASVAGLNGVENSTPGDPLSLAMALESSGVPAGRSLGQSSDQALSPLAGPSIPPGGGFPVSLGPGLLLAPDLPAAPEPPEAPVIVAPLPAAYMMFSGGFGALLALMRRARTRRRLSSQLWLLRGR